MLFGKNDSPFKDNDICKRCINKPCRFLLAGHLYPGKVTFLSRSELYLYPCYTPSWVRNKDENAGEPAALTDDLVVISEPLTIKNPRWEHKDPVIKENTPDTASFGDTIILMADVTGYPEGGAMTFDIYETSGDPPMVVDRASGKNEKGVVKGEWVVKDKSGKGVEAKIEFEAVVRSKSSGRCEIPLSTEVVWGVCQGPDKIPIENLTFVIFENGTEIYRGKTASDGTVKVPFSKSDTYIIDFVENE